MAKHLTDKQKKNIIADSVNGSSIRTLATKYKVSTTTIQRVLKSDSELTQKVTHKKEENTNAVLEHMNSKKKDVCTLIDTLLLAINDSTKIQKTPINLLATTMGILIDKFTANEVRSSDIIKENNVFDAINNCVKEDYNDIPELQQKTEANTDMVE